MKVSQAQNVKKRAGFSTWKGAVKELTKKVVVVDVYDNVDLDNE